MDGAIEGEGGMICLGERIKRGGKTVEVGWETHQKRGFLGINSGKDEGWLEALVVDKTAD